MTAECYYGDCIYHDSQTDPDSGPYCNEPICKASTDELQVFSKQREIYLKESKLKIL